MLQRFLCFLNVHDFHHPPLSPPLSLSSSLPLLPLSHLFCLSVYCCGRFFLFFVLLLPLVAASVAALVLVLVVVCGAGGGVCGAGGGECGAALLLRFGTVFRYFRLYSLSLRPLLSSCQVHSSAQRVTCMRAGHRGDDERETPWTEVVE